MGEFLTISVYLVIDRSATHMQPFNIIIFFYTGAYVPEVSLC